MKSVQRINYKEQPVRETCQAARIATDWNLKRDILCIYFHLASKAGVFFWARAKDACFHCVVVD